MPRVWNSFTLRSRSFRCSMTCVWVTDCGHIQHVMGRGGLPLLDGASGISESGLGVCPSPDESHMGIPPKLG